LEGKSHQYFCETGDNSLEWTLEWAEPDESRHGSKYVFALKSRTVNERKEYELL